MSVTSEFLLQMKIEKMMKNQIHTGTHAHTQADTNTLRNIKKHEM
jgi:hypothetical protein